VISLSTFVILVVAVSREGKTIATIRNSLFYKRLKDSSLQFMKETAGTHYKMTRPEKSLHIWLLFLV